MLLEKVLVQYFIEQQQKKSTVEHILAHLYQYTFYCKLKKCSCFLCNITKFLSFDVTSEGMHISDSKVRSLNEWPVSTTLKKAQSFFGFVQYFCKFVCHFSAIVELLHKLICKYKSLIQTKLCPLMFKELKYHVVSTHVLEIYDGSTNTQVEVHIDASTKALSAILLQKLSAIRYFHSIAYYSKKVKNALWNYSAMDHEILAILEALQHQQLYLHGKKFIVCTDHWPLTYFFAQHNLSPLQLHWEENLADFLPLYSIYYAQGYTNILPDAISQCP